MGTLYILIKYTHPVFKLVTSRRTRNTHHEACSTGPTNVIQQDANHPVNDLKKKSWPGRKKRRKKKETNLTQKHCSIFFLVLEPSLDHQSGLEIQFLEQFY